MKWRNEWYDLVSFSWTRLMYLTEAVKNSLRSKFSNFQNASSSNLKFRDGYLWENSIIYPGPKFSKKISWYKAKDREIFGVMDVSHPDWSFMRDDAHNSRDIFLWRNAKMHPRRTHPEGTLSPGAGKTNIIKNVSARMPASDDAFYGSTQEMSGKGRLFEGGRESYK